MRVVTEACRPPADVGVPVTHWSLSLLAAHLGAQGIFLSSTSVGRILRNADLQPHRQRMWLTSHDDEFREKRDDVLRVYYETPAHEHIICVDEKTQMQALERRFPDLPLSMGEPLRRDGDYLRHGTLVLMGAFDVRTGVLFGFVEARRGRTAFVALLDWIDECYPTGRGHIICDNLIDHCGEEVDEWFEEHPRWQRHFTPKHASWLNQIELKFAQLQREVLRRSSFTSTRDLKERVEAWMCWDAHRATPFRWSYRPKSWGSNPAQTSGTRH